MTLIETVLSLEPWVGGVAKGAKNPDVIVDDLAKKFIEEMPEFLTDQGSNWELWKTNKEGLLPSLTTYLSQEMLRFNKLIQWMISTIHDLRKAIKGEAVMSDELDWMYQSFLNNKVPDNWSDIAYPSLKPLASWIENLKERIEFF